MKNTIIVVISLLLLAIIGQPKSVEYHLENPSEMVKLVNLERAKEHLPALKESSALDLSAHNKACDMKEKNYFDHVSPEGRHYYDWMRDIGWPDSFSGENLSMGYTTFTESMNGLMHSPPHRENIMMDKYNKIGIGVCGNYIVQHFSN